MSHEINVAELGVEEEKPGAPEIDVGEIDGEVEVEIHGDTGVEVDGDTGVEVEFDDAEGVWSDVVLKQWVLDIVFAEDNVDDLLFALRCIFDVEKGVIVDLLKEALQKGAHKCIRALTPFTGPDVLDFGDAEWAEVRREALSAVGILDDRVDTAILEVANIPWLSWTRNLPGLLHECIGTGNYDLARRLVRKGYMEGTGFGGVLNSIWDMLEDFEEHDHPARSKLSMVFDELIALVKDCKDETLLCAEEHDSALAHGAGDDEQYGMESDPEESALSDDDEYSDADGEVDEADIDAALELLREQRARSCRFCPQCTTDVCTGERAGGRKRGLETEGDEGVEGEETMSDADAPMGRKPSWIGRVLTLLLYPWFGATAATRAKAPPLKKMPKRAKMHAE